MTGSLKRRDFWARHLHERGRLNLEEAVVDAIFASAKKGLCSRAHPSRQGYEDHAIAAHNSLPFAISVQSASPAECHRVEEVLGGSFLDEPPSGSSAIKPTVRTRSTRSSLKSTA